MAGDQTKTTGTPTGEGGDAAEHAQTTGTTQTEDRDAKSTDTPSDIEKLNLEWKAKAERVNEVEARLAELEARQPQPPAAEDTESDDLTPAEFARVQAAADLGDWQAQAIVKQQRAIKKDRTEREALVRDLILVRQLDKIPEDEQEGVKKHYDDHPGRFRDFRHARADLREKQLDPVLKENEKLKARIAALEQKPDPEVMGGPPALGREISAAETKTRRTTQAEFDREQAQLEAAGNMKLKFQRQRDLSEGRIQFNK